ncbi:hypothetical protein [Microbacterium sp. NPDC058345]|uniref:hypothetical protein n=1 Tax=Microbacterium sp. NPDC058345 TaxID=3346455 RepID=UPI003646E416
MRRNDTFSLGPAIPGHTLRAVAIGVAVGAAILLSAPVGWVVVIGLVCAVGAVWPQTAGVWLAAAGAGLMLLLNEPHPARAAVAIAAVHLLHVLASLTSVIPMRAAVSLRALAPTGIRFAWMQGIGQAASLVVHLLPRGPAVPFAVLAGAGASLTVGVLAGRMLRAQRSHAFSPPDSHSAHLAER